MTRARLALSLGALLLLTLTLLGLPSVDAQPERHESATLAKRLAGKRAVLYHGQAHWLLVLEGSHWTPPAGHFHRGGEVKCTGTDGQRLVLVPTQDLQRVRFLIRPEAITVVEPPRD
jgi:hypothetical protein